MNLVQYMANIYFVFERIKRKVITNEFETQRKKLSSNMYLVKNNIIPVQLV